jgi:hypothetical protein
MQVSKNSTGRLGGVLLLLAAGIAGYLIFTALSGRQTDAGLGFAYRSLSFNVILVSAALAAGRLPGLLLGESWKGKLAPAALAGGYVLAGVGLWRGLTAFAGEWSVMSGIGLVCLAGAAALAVSHLAVYAQRYEFGGVFSGVFRWLIDTRALVLVIGIGAGTYAFIIRPLFMGNWTYSVLVEWIVILMVGIVMLGITQFQISRGLGGEAEASAADWRRHRQQVSPKIDGDYAQVRRLERRFVGEADHTMLFHFLVSVLARNEVGEAGTAKTLTPLIECWGIRGYGREAKRLGEEERGQLLKTVVAGMQSAVQPSRYSRSPRQAAQTPDSLAIGEEPQTLSDLVEVFCKKGDCSRLLVRLSLMLTASGTREDDIDEVLRPVVTYHQGIPAGRGGRERLWRDVVATAARYAPKVRLKE